MTGITVNQRKLLMPVDWRFWLWWVLASAAGFGIGGPLGMLAASGGSDQVAGYVGASAAGVVAGMLQWLALRQRIDRPGRWALAGILTAAALGVVVLGVSLISADAGLTGGVILMGAALGALQWLVLRRQVARAGWWIPVSAVGWIIAGFLSGAVPAGNPAGWVLIGAIYGAITGLMLAWLLLHRPPSYRQGR